MLEYDSVVSSTFSNCFIGKIKSIRMEWIIRLKETQFYVLWLNLYTG